MHKDLLKRDGTEKKNMTSRVYNIRRDQREDTTRTIRMIRQKKNNSEIDIINNDINCT